MGLTNTQRRVAEALELGISLDEVVERGLCSAKSLTRWNIQELRAEYRATIAPPRLNIRRELDRLTPEAILAVGQCLRGEGKQTQLLAARFVLEAGLEVEEAAGAQDDEGVAELRNLLTLAS